MKIILSPAKKMNSDTDTLDYLGFPQYLNQTEEILAWLKQKNFAELKSLWRCNDKITEQNVSRLTHMDLRKGLTPAILSYEGIAYQYLAPSVLEQEQMEYLQEHLRILSAFYGVLKPMDGVTPYRLEMQAKAAINGHKDLYDFWGRRLYEAVLDEDRVIVNLASKEYSKCIEAYLSGEAICITCVFGEIADGKVIQKGTYAKMARGEMVRYMAEKQIADPQEMKGFARLQYRFCETLSSEREYIFIRKGD